MKDKILEELAELEHKQWIAWVEYLKKHYNLPTKLVEKWNMNLYPYKDLRDDVKEKDRVWARKVLKVFDKYEKFIREEYDYQVDQRNAFYEGEKIKVAEQERQKILKIIEECRYMFERGHYCDELKEKIKGVKE